MPNSQTVFIVDDDEQSRKSIHALVSSMRLDVEQFASAEEFLERYIPGRSGCLVTDVRMCGMSGLELQEELIRRNIRLPVVILTAFARTPMTVRAIKAGAVTLLEKPYADDDLWDAIRAALSQDAVLTAEFDRRGQFQARVERLTSGERVVMDMIVAGKPNKQIAAELDLSLRTVEKRRHEVFQKMEVGSVAELARAVLEAGVAS